MRRGIFEFEDRESQFRRSQDIQVPFGALPIGAPGL